MWKYRASMRGSRRRRHGQMSLVSRWRDSRSQVIRKGGVEQGEGLGEFRGLGMSLTWGRDERNQVIRNMK